MTRSNHPKFYAPVFAMLLPLAFAACISTGGDTAKPVSESNKGAGTVPATSAKSTSASAESAKPTVQSTAAAAQATANASGVYSFEAESPDNDFGPSVTKDDDDVGGKASGGHYVGYLGSGAEQILRFKKVNVPDAGEYVLTIYYMTGEERSAYVSVNGGAKNMIAFESTGDFSSADMGTHVMNVTLKAGDNTIELGNAEGFAPDIDRITLKKAQ